MPKPSRGPRAERERSKSPKRQGPPKQSQSSNEDSSDDYAARKEAAERKTRALELAEAAEDYVLNSGKPHHLASLNVGSFGTGRVVFGGYQKPIVFMGRGNSDLFHCFGAIDAFQRLLESRRGLTLLRRREFPLEFWEVVPPELELLRGAAWWCGASPELPEDEYIQPEHLELDPFCKAVLDLDFESMKSFPEFYQKLEWAPSRPPDASEESYFKLNYSPDELRHRWSRYVADAVRGERNRARVVLPLLREFAVERGWLTPSGDWVGESDAKNISPNADAMSDNGARGRDSESIEAWLANVPKVAPATAIKIWTRAKELKRFTRRALESATEGVSIYPIRLFLAYAVEMKRLLSNRSKRRKKQDAIVYEISPDSR
jgi:hypothetical protein